MIAVWILLAVLFIMFMIITHEAGHFFAAKAVGIRPETFSIGFGPEIVGWDRGGTHYAIKWFLAGGSVKILGMTPDEEISEEDWPKSYYGNPPWKRAVVILAGSFVHLCIAFLLIWLVFWVSGVPVISNSARVGKVSRTATLTSGKEVAAPAYKAGIKEGDVITSVNGVAVRSWDELTKELKKRPDEEVTLEVKRGDRTLVLQTTLLDDAGSGRLGIEATINMEKTNPITAVGRAGRMIGQYSVALGKALKTVFSVKMLKVLLGTAPREEAPVMSGIGAARLSGQAAGQGISVLLSWFAYLFFFVALFNLLPIPPLDGGHLLVIIVEKISGKKIDMQKLAPVAWAVVMLIVLVGARLIMLDITNPLKNPF